MERASNGNLDFIQVPLSARKCRERNPLWHHLCGLCQASAQPARVDVCSGNPPMALSWELPPPPTPSDGHSFRASGKHQRRGTDGRRKAKQLAACLMTACLLDVKL